ncbi:hypothetical protein [Micromonospora sp. NPDC049171]|uniref:hypothetical protein n=1 Tax=Micromonospora sp. NPDC049171 TaxID=3155770 RepID=UPI0033F197C9
MDTSATPPPDTTTPTGTPPPASTHRRSASAAGKPGTPAAGRRRAGRHRTGSADANAANRPTGSRSGSTASRTDTERPTETRQPKDTGRPKGTGGPKDTGGPTHTGQTSDTDQPTTTAAGPTGNDRPATDPPAATSQPTTGRSAAPQRGATKPTTRATTRSADSKPTTRSAATKATTGQAATKPTTGQAATKATKATTTKPTTTRSAATEPTTAQPAGTRRTATGRGAGRTPATSRADDTADTAGPVSASRRRRTVLFVLGLTAVASATALVFGLLSWAPDPPEPARPLTSAEGERLAAVRVTNLRDLRAGVRVTAGVDAARIELVGWVDWSRSLLYLDVGGPGAGAERGLVQRAGPVLVIRPDAAAVPTPAAPPLVPPADRWRLHRLPSGASLAAVLDLLLGLAADRPDATPTVPGDATRWIARDTVAGGPVDVLQAPLLARTPPAGSTAAPTPQVEPTDAGPDGQTRYWLDQDARLHKLVTRLPGVGPVTVTLHRADRPTLRPVDALGGRPGLPRALTDAEQRRLDRLPARLRAQGGAAVTLTAPTGTDTNLRGAGWLSWTARTAYLTVADLAVPDRRTLLRRDIAGQARADLPAAAAGGGTAEAPGRPPLPPPAGAWRVSRSVGDDVSLLVDAAVAAGSVGPRGAAVRVREDVTAGRTVDVVEVGPAAARLRYWIDRDGSLRRLELRTHGNAWAQLDLHRAVVPRLAPVPRPAAKPRPPAPRPR